MKHILPSLKYKYNALEPYIDSITMKIHHQKHHAGYVNNLNKLIEKDDNLVKLGVEDLLINSSKLSRTIRQGVVNNAGGHANHSMFWEIMAPKKNGGGGGPQGEMADLIDASFGSFDNFKKQVSEKALSVFGSGWVFILLDNNKLRIKRHSFQNSPLLSNKIPIMGIDVWEHAYYLKYQYRRADYVAAWWNIANWEAINKRYKLVKIHGSKKKN